MQRIFDFGGSREIAEMRARLDGLLIGIEYLEPQPPMDQLVKSLISGQTFDAVSQAAYLRLAAAYGDWYALAADRPANVLAVIADVTHAERKAGHLVAALRQLVGERTNLALDFLGNWHVDDAMIWLERLPGIAVKSAAATLNFSTLNMPAFVPDTHVVRVAQRYGMVSANAKSDKVYTHVMGSTDGWSGWELTELHVAIKRLGQLICRPKAPLCTQCPLADRCLYARARH